MKSLLAIERNIVISMSTPEEQAEIKKEAQDQYLAVAFILGPDRSKYGKLMIDNLKNYYLQSRNNYSKTLTSAYILLTNWKHDPCIAMPMMGLSNDGVSFALLSEGDNSEQGTNLAYSGQ